MKQALTEKEIVRKVDTGGVLSPKGFYAGGVHAGLRYSKLDIGIILSETPASCAAVYTTSHFQAAPIIVTKDSIAKEGKIQAVIVNSACANACTGERGLADAYKMRSLTSNAFNIAEHHIAVASTGVIGEYLQMDKIANGIGSIKIGKELNKAEEFQTAILTTDTVMKSSCYTGEIDGKTVYMGGAAKGSGMIHPNMATMLGFLTTDANISPENLNCALKEITDVTFNQITVDGDTSTNDMVIVLANGEAGNEPLTPEHSEWQTFVQLLKANCESLAKQIARDGEGATKLVEVEVLGALSDDEARAVAKQIVGSNLVKTAIYGADANWGRIIGAVGQAEVFVNPNKVDVKLGGLEMLKASTPLVYSEEEAKSYLEKDTIVITVNLNVGEGTGKAWGCDLSYDYVKINASYRT
ncbi:bifunctional ornithine acetyltransferase/N-acetylglutamate synthase [Mesobacillus maritimus]|uniref:bifunctional ornithine acetyltransferase/N-acetylglutamate synthase n=1 Tax=Mesobacillus maritimus TaxID=1643336 RepID=UPI00203D719A|nr:bifunctional ornithine acetyltransferase/N-acetylglutamate synthase [Mesobacillus maritimus]MCM3586129.1 bifunctional ornithine acetyltransferase/N-acetylglutamate synthase [Mesobacillus maritimus]MCM3667456.1 bifunctional ornithine acetyltransferase/N-acetylglutamate synthase [Mesobacillus maritimus]